jgi:4-amino-4-deoxy-L-arabinose transferase-like glycosyltransferase
MPALPRQDSSHRAPSFSPAGGWLGFAFIVLVALAWFAGIGSRPLIEPDEGRYAEIAREMFVSGDWVMPRFNGLRFYDKPPLHYWITTSAYHAFGIAQWTARLWSALAGLLCVVAVWYAARRVWDARRGRLAALVCISLLLVALGGHLNTLDMGVTAFLTAALAAFMIAEHGCTDADAQRRWMLATWAAMALAVLSKGLIGIVLPGATLVTYMLWQRDGSLLRRLRILPGLSVLLLVTAPWFVLLARRDGNFLSFFFIHEHFGRFLSQVADRNHAWWYYLPVLVVGTLPWTGFLLTSLRTAWRRSTIERDAPTRLLLSWAAIVLLFFSVSGAKLPLYILPMIPALAILIAGAIAQLAPRAIARRLLPVALLAIVGAALVAWLPHTHMLGGRNAAYVPMCNPIALSMLLLGAGTGAAVVLARRAKVDAAIAAAALGGLLFAQGMLFAYQRVAPVVSAQSISALARPYLRIDAPVYAVQRFQRGMPFYLQRRIVLVDERPYDLRAGMAWDPDLSLPDLASFTGAWTSHPGALAFMREGTFRTLSARQLPMRIVANQAGTLVVQNPLPPAQ